MDVKVRFRHELEYLESLQVHRAVTLLLPQKTNLTQIRQRIKSEITQCKNIKSTATRSEVKESLTSLSEFLNGLSTVPACGLAVFHGCYETEGTLRQCLEPPVPIRDLIYSCDSALKLGPLWKLLRASEEALGYIIVDGSGVLVASVSSNGVDVKNDDAVRIPNKHARGGQSAARFARLRLEAQQQHLKKSLEKAQVAFLEDTKPTVKGIVLGGSGCLKDKLAHMMTPPLRALLRKTLTVSYGGRQGLKEAMAQTEDLLDQITFDQNQKFLDKVFEGMAKGDMEMVSLGETDVVACVEAGAAERVILYEDSPLLPRFMELCTESGTELSLVPLRSQESQMLVKGLGGVAALHRYPFTPPSVWEELLLEEEDY